jgi:hypothetical protein
MKYLIMDKKNELFEIKHESCHCDSTKTDDCRDVTSARVFLPEEIKAPVLVDWMEKG